ncbi:nicotinate phosphoribosyltransferase [Candidatus Woesearchaeota archaeon]|nr:nicotinate phosphoribosyltransferase [Candidatus Woesearchaeota archaeon]
MQGKTMLTDLYQLTMAAAYFENGKNDTATFELFIRNLPDNWGYYIANGIEDAIDYATGIEFTPEDISYLRQQGTFSEAFLEFLKDMRFTGDIYALREGAPFFPDEPVLRVTGKRAEVQFLETALLNIINFQTMIATKASRVVNAANGAAIVDFGLRRAQGEDAAMEGARAAYIGGAVATSNVKAGMEYGIPVAGTHAHSFVMSFQEEIDAFRAYARTFPDKSTLLIDTYDTIQGARNAVTVAKELEAEGKRLYAVRLDSGDLAGLSIEVRQMFDDEGMGYVRIVASNDLNEYKIEELRRRGARIDAYGVGTEMITAKPVAAISGVYKLVEDEDGAKIKLSEGKQTLPGKKQVYRVVDGEGRCLHDVIALEGEHVEGVPLLEQVVRDGRRVAERKTLKETRSYALACVGMLPDDIRAVRAPADGYRVELSEGLQGLVQVLKEKYAMHACAEPVLMA